MEFDTTTRVAAEHSEGQSALSDEVSVTPLVPRPGAPRDVSAVAGVAEVNLNWKPPEDGATIYNIYWAQGGGSRVKTNVSVPYRLTGLQPGVPATFSVTAVTQGRESLPSASVSVTPLFPPPARPTGMNVKAGDRQVTLQWTSIPDAVSYNLYWNTTGNVSTADERISGVLPPFTHVALENGATYFYRVTTVNEHGESLPSDEIQATPVPMKKQPATPAALTAEAGDGQVTLSWEPVSGVTGYNLYWNTTGTFTQSDAPITNVTSPYVHTNLNSDGTRYFYAITALAGQRESAPSTVVSAIPNVRAAYRVSGTVTGLTGSGLVLQNNGGDDLAISTDGSFTFVTTLTNGDPYNVTVLTAPTNPTQACKVANASGTVNGASAADVTVTCRIPGPAPVAKISFPPPVSTTEASQLTVTGTASDDGVIKAVRVNGVEAQSDDGFNTWRAVVPIEMGTTNLVVETEDANGDIDPLAVQAVVRNSGKILTIPRHIELDSANNRALMVDYGAVLAVDLTTGQRTVLSDADTGVGRDFFYPHGIALDGAHNRVLVTHEKNGNPFPGVIAVDLTSGDRIVLWASLNIDHYSMWTHIHDIVVDNVNNRVFATNRLIPSALLALELDSGDWVIVSK